MFLFLSISSCINEHGTCPVLNIFNLRRWWRILGVLYYIPFLYYALSLSVLCHFWRIKEACGRVSKVVISIVSLFQLVPILETAISNMLL